MTKTLAVCGDSWFCSDIKFPGRSFGEILANKKQWNFLSLARGGCSNFAIALQIDKAIELSADFIIVGTTSADRIEVPIMSDKTKSIWAKAKSVFTHQDWFTAQPSIYDKSRGLANIQYSPHPDLSSNHSFLVDPTIISESLNNLAFQSANSKLYNLTDEQIQALKFYMLNLYDFKLKQQIDSWIISDACRRLLSEKIPFLIFTDGLGEYRTDLSWIPTENTIMDDFHLHNYYDPAIPSPRFHYKEDAGETISNYLNTRIEQL
jgi:hypothetical protein